MSQFGSNAIHSRAASSALALCALLALVTCGCVAPGYDPAKEVLFEEKLHIEPRLGVFIPAEGDFDPGTVIATRISYQYDYGSYFSLEFSGSGAVDQTAPLAVDAMGFPITDFRVQNHRGLSSVQRRSFILSFDWDYRLSKSETVPYLRWGLGIGILNTQNSTNPALRAGPAPFTEGFDSTDQAMILTRPTLGVFWDPVENLSMFVDAQYDYAQSKLEYDGRMTNDNSKSGVVDFSGINLLFGLSISF